jgi:hypothetical protein
MPLIEFIGDCEMNGKDATSELLGLIIEVITTPIDASAIKQPASLLENIAFKFINNRLWSGTG